MSDRSGRSQIDVQASPFARRFCKSEPLHRGRMRLRIDDMPVDIRSRATRQNLIIFLNTYFIVSNEDGDELLTEAEFSGLIGRIAEPALMAGFSIADMDEDSHVSRDELSSWIERDTLATQSRIEVSVRQDGKTLFSLLDRNSDRRLAQRELQESLTVLKEYDLNGDDQLAESELGTEYILQIGLGQPESMRGPDRMMTGDMVSTDAILPGIENLTGPQWFRRMDRNQDGDLSRREFLGTRAQFDQLDADDDSLIDADEAE